MRLRVAMVTGSYPPVRCGVGDYTHQLARALKSRNVDVHVFTSRAAGIDDSADDVHAEVPGWSVPRMVTLVRTLRRLDAHLVHVQYPTLGYGYGMGPHALAAMLRAMRVSVVTTIHEFERAHPLRKLSLLLFCGAANRLIFTSSAEREAAQRAMPRLRAQGGDGCHVIPVGSNIPVPSDCVRSVAAEPVVAYFGLFYPGKLVELVVNAFSRLARRHPTIRFRFIGDIHPRYPRYFRQIEQLVANRLPPDRVDWVRGGSPAEVAETLGTAWACLLPYPDGATFRRTTLLAALSLGVPVVTTRGVRTPDLLAAGGCVLFAANEREMAEMTTSVLADPGLAKRMTEQGRAVSKLFSWDKIADAHLDIYQSLFGGQG